MKERKVTKTRRVVKGPKKEERISDDDTWVVVKAFFDEYGLFHHQYTSFNEFIEKKIPQIVENNRKIEVSYGERKYKVVLGDINMLTPKYRKVDETTEDLLPQTAINCSMTYSSELYIDMTMINDLGEQFSTPHVLFGSIPVMVNSKLCNLYPIKDDIEKLAELKEDILPVGGKFIIEGSVRKLTAQQNPAQNIPLVLLEKGILKVEIKSCALGGMHTTNTCIYFKDDCIYSEIPYIDIAKIPIGILFKALGVIDEHEILGYITQEDPSSDTFRKITACINPSLEQSYEVASMEQALHFIGKKGKKFLKTKDTEDDSENPDTENLKEEKERAEKQSAVSYAHHLLTTQFLPHADSIDKKKIFLGIMVEKLVLTRLKLRPTDDRDDKTNQRLAHVGALLGSQFANCLRRLSKDVTKFIERSLQKGRSVNRTCLINTKSITTGMRSAISSNMWSRRGYTDGISQICESFNYSGSIADNRKCVTPVDPESSKINQPREAHCTQRDVLCPSETPEGKKTGLIGNMALASLMSFGSDPYAIIEILETMRIIPISEIKGDKLHLLKHAKIFVNGNPIGVTLYPKEIVRELIAMRRRVDIDPEVSIAYNIREREIKIVADEGRILNPMLIVENGELLLKPHHIQKIKSGEASDMSSIFYWLLEEGVVELLDTSERSQLLCVNYPSDLDEKEPSERLKISHCVLHPTLMYGVGVNKIPFSNHNQSPRNCYQAGMGKQAVGIPCANFMHVTKSSYHLIEYPQKPIVTTKSAEVLGLNQLPSGQNAIVFVTTYQGYGEEDAIIVNKNSVDRGFLNSFKMIPYEEKLNPKKKEQFEIPLEEECSRFKMGLNTSKLDERGIVRKGEIVYEGDVIIGKTITIGEGKVGAKHFSANIANGDEKSKINASVVYDQRKPGQVHDVIFDIDGKGYRYVRVNIAQRREFEEGDKAASGHAQKGVCTLKEDAVNLPFTETGVCPDVIFDPLGMPSRMTIGMLIEMLTGIKICATHALNNVRMNKVFQSETGDRESKEPFARDIKYSPFKHNSDGTSFQKPPSGAPKDYTVRRICEELQSLGIDGFSDTPVFNGMTGELVPCLIFVGICNYQRLKHMVCEKYHARARGPKSFFIRQPVEGRKLGGGFRYGNMERDGTFAQGCPNIVRDRMMEQSDQHKMYFCKVCGMSMDKVSDIAGKLKGECRLCQSNKIAKVELPYATKLMMQEFMAMNVVFRTMTDPFGEVLVKPSSTQDIVSSEIIKEEVVEKKVAVKKPLKRKSSAFSQRARKSMTKV